MTISIILPVHDKPAEVVARVIDAAEAQEAEQIVAVLDRPSASVLEVVSNGTGVIRLDGPPGWRSPCIAANAGLKEVTGDITVYLPSDIVMATGAIAWLKAQLGERFHRYKAAFEAGEPFGDSMPAVYFAKVLESDPEACNGAGSAGPVLCSSENPRPLTYMVAMPTAALRAAGGWDEAFQDGVCYEDDDLMARLWAQGLDFVFDDAFSGTHISHPRTYWNPIRIAPNMAHMLRKHGTLRYFDREARRGKLAVFKTATAKLEIEHTLGRTIWRHA